MNNALSTAGPMAGIPTGSQRAQTRWRLAILSLLAAVIFGLYWRSTLPLIELWLDTERKAYTHGLVLFAVAIGLLARKGREIALAPWKPSMRSLVSLMCLTLAWLVLVRASLQTAHELLLPAILWTSILAVFGAPIARLCAFPCAFLVFTIPVWDFMNRPLQSATVAVVGRALHLAGVPVHIDGDFVQIPAGTFEIAGGCSGLHFLVVALAVGALYGEICDLPLLRRGLLLVLAAGLGILSNWLRVFCIILAGHRSAMHSYLVTVDHYWFGWLVFACAEAVFFWLAWKLTGTQQSIPAPHAATVGDSPPRVAAVATLTLLLLGIGPAWAAARQRLDPGPIPKALPPASSDWTGPLPATEGWQPQYPGADWQGSAAYRNDHRLLQLYVAAYATQGHAKKLVGYGVSMLGDADVITAEGTMTAAGLPVLEIRLLDGRNENALLWAWYDVGSRRFTSGTRAQLWYGLASLFTAPPSRVVLLRSACQGDCARARIDMENFLRENDGLARGNRGAG